MTVLFLTALGQSGWQGVWLCHKYGEICDDGGEAATWCCSGVGCSVTSLEQQQQDVRTQSPSWFLHARYVIYVLLPANSQSEGQPGVARVWVSLWVEVQVPCECLEWGCYWHFIRSVRNNGTPLPNLNLPWKGRLWLLLCVSWTVWLL